VVADDQGGVALTMLVVFLVEKRRIVGFEDMARCAEIWRALESIK